MGNDKDAKQFRAKYKKAEVKVDPETGSMDLELLFNHKELLIFRLEIFRNNGKMRAAINKKIDEAIEYLEERIITLKINKGEEGELFKLQYDYRMKEGETSEEVEKKLADYFEYRAIQFIICDVLGNTTPFLDKIQQEDELRAKELLKREESLKKKEKEASKREKKLKKPRPKVGKHLIDNALKSSYPEPQLDIFTGLLEVTKNKINEFQSSVEQINRKGEGVKFNKGEYKLLFCLSEILHEKSQTTDRKKIDYYTGNRGSDVVKFPTPQGEIELISPKIGFTLYEVTQKFTGLSHPGGASIREVAAILDKLANDRDKKCLLRYTKRVDLPTRKKGDEHYREYFIERYDSLVAIDTIGWNEIQNGETIDQKKEIIVSLHPIVRDQIEKIHITLPTQREQIEAYGSPNVSEITQKLIYELSRAHSNKKKLEKNEAGQHVYTIGQEKLFYKIGENYLPPNKKRLPLLLQYFEKSVETTKKLGLIDSYELKDGAEGNKNICFTLCKDWF